MSWETAGNIKGPPGDAANAPVQSVFGRIGAIVADATDYEAFYQPLGAYPVSSVFGRTGAIVADSADYASFYQPLGSYEAPLTFAGSVNRATNTVKLVNDLADITGPTDANKFYGTDAAGVRGFYALPSAPVSSVFGRTGAVVAQASDYASFYQPLGSYESPLTFQYSVVRSGNTINLSADQASPGPAKYYGTEATGIKGWHALPSPSYPVTSVFTRTGAITAQAADYSAFYPSLSAGYANPSWITSLAWSKITGAPAFEPALGNPASDGMVLSSTVAGVRSWIAAGAPAGQALTRTNDTNVTLTLGGSPNTALLAAASIAVGWSGTLALARGGLGGAVATPAIGGQLRAVSTSAFDSFPTNSYHDDSIANVPLGTGTTPRACGIAATLQMKYSGKVLVAVSGRMYCNTANGYGGGQIKYGTGTPPAQNVNISAIGTPVGNVNFQPNLQPANTYFPLNFQAIISDLTIGTTYWFDLSYYAANAAWACGWANLVIDIIEL
jgi:hypothetical protein